VALDTAARRPRRHRAHRLELAPHAPERIRGQVVVRQRTTLRRLFRYATPYRGRLAWAVVGMIVYAVGSAGLAWLIKPIFDSVLPKQEEVALIAWGIVGVYLLKGIGSYVSSYLTAVSGERDAMDPPKHLYPPL